MTTRRPPEAPRIFVRASLGNKGHRQFSSRIEKEILTWLISFPWQRAYLQVSYDGKYNEGTYFNLKEFKKALAAFTE